MGKLEELVRLKIKLDVTKMTLHIFQLVLIVKITEGLNIYLDSLMIFSTPYVPHRGIA